MARKKKLTFKKKSDSNEYMVWCGTTYLGDIAIYKKISDLFLYFPDDFQMIGDMWFWSDCLRQIADKLDELNSTAIKPKTK